MSTATRQRRSQRGHGEDEGYWPGYVDALVNVVLNLLFLLAILTLAAFVLGQKVGQDQQRSPAPSAAQRAGLQATEPKEKPLGSRPAQRDWSVPDRVAVQTRQPTQAADDRQSLAVSGVREAGDGQLITVLTPANAWLMSQLVQADFLKALQDSMGQPKGQVALWTNTDKDPQRQRLDYLRVIQLREWLLRMGVKPEQIQLRLAEGGTVEKEVAPLFIWVEKE